MVGAGARSWTSGSPSPPPWGYRTVSTPHGACRRPPRSRGLGSAGDTAAVADRHDRPVAPAGSVRTAGARRYLRAGLGRRRPRDRGRGPAHLPANAQPAAKAILRQDYGGNLTLLLGIIVAASLLLYAAHLARVSLRPARPLATARETNTNPENRFPDWSRVQD